ncbi:uncharacterized protein LOC134218146 [Armigeres subalbatus]|uniref:uncharacterized protein LOC134218146 n=1 Tax=Armigeres subalbatus TaxID=124917 RepID=UPI002ED4F9D1
MLRVRDNNHNFYRGIHLQFPDAAIGSKQSGIDPVPVAETLKQCRKLSNAAQDQYIKLRSPDSSGLPYSAKIWCGEAFWKLHGEGSLVTIGSNYVAQVSIAAIPELEDATDFESAKELLLTHLRTDNVLVDQLQKDTTEVVGWVELTLCDLANKCATNTNSAISLLELWRIAEKHNFKLSGDFSEEVSSNELIDNDLKVATKEIVKTHSKLETRSLFQRGIKWIQKMVGNTNILEQSLKTMIENYKQHILKICNSQLQQKILHFESNRCLLIREDDVKLFSGLECCISDQLFREVLPKIETKFAKRVAAIKKVDYYGSLPLVNGVYFHVCKSMIEIAKRVEMELDIQDILEYENEWKINRIDNNQVASKTSKCWVKQLEMLVSFANHYEPGKPTARENYPYEFKSDLFKRSQFNYTDFSVWFYLVDATVMSVFQENIERTSLILDIFYKCVSTVEPLVISQESVRMVAHNTIEFVAQIEQSGIGNNARDAEILRMQISSIGSDFLSSSSVFTQYRDIMDVFTNYWERINEVIPKLSSKLEGKHFHQQVDEIASKLSIITSQVLDKKAPSKALTVFFRIYNDLLTDLQDIPLEWYVRVHQKHIKNNTLYKRTVQNVNNRLSYTDNACHRVQKGSYDKFAGLFAPDEIPNHYQIDVLKTLLDEINRIGQKQEWEDGDRLSVSDQIYVTGLLINAIRSSLLYLKEQPDYIDFEAYYEETIKPFSSVIDESESLENFAKRVELVKESFWYIRNQTAIGIDKALELFDLQNSNFDEDLLKTAFQLYDDQYLEYMSANSDWKDCGRIELIVEHLRGKTKSMPSSKWTSAFKQTVIPTILAGLGAVWSIMISKDVASSGKFLKLHSIQVLSIFRLLGVDVATEGVDKHLAEILTGQGKSVVLALAAAVLALFGHEVVIVCYSSYLAERDAKDFQAFFAKFSIEFKIKYKIFEDMAWHEIQSLYGKATKYVSKCIGVANPTASNNYTADYSNTVLLIDEVDVFFMDKFYGATYNPGFLPVVAGLGRIQQQIWEAVQRNTESVDIKNDVLSSINIVFNPKLAKLRAFLQRRERYSLINFDDEEFEVPYTNESLFDEHLDKMISTAKEVHRRALNDEWIRKFRIDTNGNITHQDAVGVYRSTYYCGYYNIFVYFKLRQFNFAQTVNGTNNFGYLNLTFASFSYAKFPEKYPLILGVTGTLSGMSDYEQAAIENYYKIRRNSIMPSFFGATNLKFDEWEDFECYGTINQWKNAIFTRVNEIINEDRSVIVFFENEAGVTKFKNCFQSQLDRLHEITINTDAYTRERYIAEAGLSRTITLASREMGRGVDYKSSLAVEKNGGIHVIQTFFSLDVKEETQIKGRTARKDNRGSYELIVCYKQLLDGKLVQLHDSIDEIDYVFLQNRRDYLTAKDSEIKRSKLARANAAHEKSMKFCEEI